jgi:hypothetical protein
VFFSAVTGCRETEKEIEAVKNDSPPPLLVVDTDQPLLLDEATEVAAVSGADNSPCFVCHVNYGEEPLAVNHAGHDIGCVACHGDSFAHRNDENNTTPPDKLVPSDEIAKLCGKCHKSHDVDPKSVIARWQKKGIKKDPAQILCTDCHGNHRLKVRTVRWNKKTGELLK